MTSGTKGKSLASAMDKKNRIYIQRNRSVPHIRHTNIRRSIAAIPQYMYALLYQVYYNVNSFCKTNEMENCGKKMNMAWLCTCFVLNEV